MSRTRTTVCSSGRLFRNSVAFEKAFAALLSDSLGTPIVNAGVHGFGTNSCLAMLKRWLALGSFETVCLFYTLDDPIATGDHPVFPRLSQDPIVDASRRASDVSFLVVIVEEHDVESEVRGSRRDFLDGALRVVREKGMTMHDSTVLPKPLVHGRGPAARSRGRSAAKGKEAASGEEHRTQEDAAM